MIGYKNFISKIKKKFFRLDDLVMKKDAVWGFPNGHFYSPVHRQEDLYCYGEVVKRSQESFALSMPGFSENRILNNLEKLKKNYEGYDYPEQENKSSRFYVRNSSYPITDSLMLFAFIKDLKPKKIIEIGSGFTSALMMDVNERFFNNKIDITFIEPYPELLVSRMRSKDKERYKIIPKGVQEVSVEEFNGLNENDFLFIDSTHVSKFNSDVNYELFNILPNLKKGVIIHFHDICDGFEYPLKWLEDGWAWNEAYLLRAYLTNNPNYEILMMNDYLVKRHPKLLLKSFSRFNSNNGGSIWLKKIKN